MSKLILSCDGGGIRGAATTQFLYRVEDQLNRKHQTSIRDQVDFYAGTSTDSIIALALATTNLSVSEINELYNFKNAQEIFASNKGWFEFDGVNAPKYEAEGKTKFLKAKFGDAKVGGLFDDKHVLAITYDIERRKPEIIKSTEPSHLGIYSYSVADASSAAPTFFPTRNTDTGRQNDESWLVDGGIVANNPTMCAIAEARKVWQLPVDDMRVLSVGTGHRTRKINGPESRSWGALQWFLKGDIVSLLQDEYVVAYQALAITRPGSYIRVDSQLSPQPGLFESPDDAMDDISKGNIRRLKELGDFWFQEYGESAIALLLNQYTGLSLDRIDLKTGKPKVA